MNYDSVMRRVSEHEFNELYSIKNYELRILRLWLA